MGDYCATLCKAVPYVRLPTSSILRIKGIVKEVLFDVAELVHTILIACPIGRASILFARTYKFYSNTKRRT